MSNILYINLQILFQSDQGISDIVNFAFNPFAKNIKLFF